MAKDKIVQKHMVEVRNCEKQALSVLKFDTISIIRKPQHGMFIGLNK